MYLSPVLREQTFLKAPSRLALMTHWPDHSHPFPNYKGMSVREHLVPFALCWKLGSAFKPKEGGGKMAILTAKNSTEDMGKDSVVARGRHEHNASFLLVCFNTVESEHV